MEFKGTKGEWVLTDDKKTIKSKYGTIASCWSESNEDLDERLHGESWLSMRNRTKEERYIRNEIKPKANAQLISCAPEMLEMLQYLINDEQLSSESIVNDVKQLIKKATEI